MRAISGTLLAAQQSSSRVPYLRVTAGNGLMGVNRLKWERIYQGGEEAGLHAAAFAGDGSLIRVRISPDNNNLLHVQRVANPGSQSNFSLWNSTGQYECQAVSITTHNPEACIFWTTLNKQLKCMTSGNNGVTWSSPVLLDYIPDDPVNGLSACQKPNGDLAVFFKSNGTLSVKRRINGLWQGKTAWDKTTGEICSISTVYDNDWHIMLAGKDLQGNAKIWSVEFGDGVLLPAGEWSELQEFASAPADSGFSFSGIFLDKSEVYRVFFVQKFTSLNPANRVYWSHAIPGTLFNNNLWREPAPFDFCGESGLSLLHNSSAFWLSSPDAVWRAPLESQTLDITEDVIAARCEVKSGTGNLILELDNASDRYNNPGSGNITVLDIGSELTFEPGYLTASGPEVSPGIIFQVEAYELVHFDGKASLVLHASDGWQYLAAWRASYQFRWNSVDPITPVKNILEFVLARAGLKLEVISQSGSAATFCPDFTIHRGDNGTSIINRLLSFIPDLIFIEGFAAHMVNPLATDAPVYTYGLNHAILQGKYQIRAAGWNHVQVNGYDSITGENLVADSFAWDQISKTNESQLQICDRNLSTLSEAQARGDAILRKTEVARFYGQIIVPVNCGQSLYDVIEVTDAVCGLSSTKRRVTGITLDYRPAKTTYTQTLDLGGV